MVQLLVQQVSKLVQAHREVPQSQEAVVRRPIKWAQSGRLLPLLWSDSSLRRRETQMGRIALNPCIVVGSMTPIWYPRATSEKQPEAW